MRIWGSVLKGSVECTWLLDSWFVPTISKEQTFSSRICGSSCEDIMAGARPDSVCKFICDAGDWRVTNLQLQKILYLSQMFYLGKTGERLADVSFEAWDYGPVAPDVYRQVRSFGASPIKNVFYDARPFAQESPRRKVLADACRDLLAMKPSELVEITHWKNGAWSENYVPGVRGIKIPDSSIIKEFNSRLGVKPIKPD
jgi:uncharacterized phage-associated protein